MEYQEPSTDELLKALRPKNFKVLRKYPFKMKLRIEFQRFAKRIGLEITKGKPQWYWKVIYKKYHDDKLKIPRPKRFDFLTPREFLDLMRYFYPTADKRRFYFKVKATKCRLGRINVEKTKGEFKVKEFHRKRKESPENSGGS